MLGCNAPVPCSIGQAYYKFIYSNGMIICEHCGQTVQPTPTITAVA